MLKIRMEADFQQFIFQKYASLRLEKMVLSHNFQGLSKKLHLPKVLWGWYTD